MTLTKQALANEIIISVEGRLDSITSLTLQETLILAVDEYDNVSLNFEGLSYICSAGFRVLLMTHKIAVGRKCALAIRNVPAEIMRLFDMSGLTEHLSVNEVSYGEK